jgi:D-aspartate ligase
MATIPQEPRTVELRKPVQGEKIGALVVGGDHPGLAIARSLGRRGIPVYIIDDQYCVSSFSRYATKVIRVESILDERKTVDAVLEVGRRYNLRDWVLFPTRDENVAAFSRYRNELAAFFRVTTGDWNSVEWAWDKKKTYELAERLDIPCPKTFNPRSLDELPDLYSRLPLAIKPAVKENFFYATGAKAWRVNTPEQLRSMYEKAINLIRPEEILIQEIVPGDGNEQYSYCAFVRNGAPFSVLTARRARQHPREFGRAASYVETIDAPEIEHLSERFLKAIRYHGIVEIEFKRDPRNGEYKLLDVNARPWGFHAIGPAAGIDFAYLAYADQMGLPIEPVRAAAGVGWLRLVSDIPTALSDILHRTLSLRTYFKSLLATRTESVFNWSDPVPLFAEFVMLPYIVAKKYLRFQK